MAGLNAGKRARASDVWIRGELWYSSASVRRSVTGAFGEFGSVAKIGIFYINWARSSSQEHSVYLQTLTHSLTGRTQEL